MGNTSAGGRRPGRRGGLTLVELCVAVAIVAVLTTLILVAVQRARLASLRTEASNAVRQYSLAVHSFAELYGGRVQDVGGRGPKVGHAPIIAISPLLGGPEWGVPPGMRFRSDPSRGLLIGAAGPAKEEHLTSFGFNARLFVRGARLPTMAPDGLSVTIATAERYGVCGGGATLFALYSADCSGPCESHANHRAAFADRTFPDALPAPGPGGTLATLPLTFQVRPPVAECNPRAPSSSLPGGLLCGMADGAARFVAQGVSPAAFWGSVTPAGGEAAPLD